MYNLDISTVEFAKGNTLRQVQPLDSVNLRELHLMTSRDRSGNKVPLPFHGVHKGNTETSIKILARSLLT